MISTIGLSYELRPALRSAQSGRVDPTIAKAIARDDGLINRVARYKGLTLFLAAPVIVAMTLATVLLFFPLGATMALGGKTPILHFRHVLSLESRSNSLTIYLQRSLYPMLGRAVTTVMLVQEYFGSLG